jgi:hypothetical protein
VIPLPRANRDVGVRVLSRQSVWKLRALEGVVCGDDAEATPDETQHPILPHRGEKTVFNHLSLGCHGNKLWVGLLWV